MMRIVGLTNWNSVVIQKRNEKTRKWEQETLDYTTFKNMMETEHPRLYNKFLNSGSEDIGEYFYRYGETPEMILKGDAYIFN